VYCYTNLALILLTAADDFLAVHFSGACICWIKIYFRQKIFFSPHIKVENTSCHLRKGDGFAHH